MGIFDLFSKRQKKLRGEFPDVYVYQEIPNSLRVQIVHIIQDTIGSDKSYSQKKSSEIYNFLHKTLCKEYGVFKLIDNENSSELSVLNYFLRAQDYEQCLDIIELAFRVIVNHIGQNYGEHQYYTTSRQHPNDAVIELNARFKEAGVGYQFESEELIRVDSQYIHSEAVKPVLHLLNSNTVYQGANDEFLSAHEHYRHKRYKECLNDCLKAFESLMKAIHKKHNWQYNPNDTAKKLINSCLTNNLVPEYLQSQFSSIRILLESGIPTVRNKEGGHGQGSNIVNVPEHLASYTLHLTATNLLFLMNCEKNYK
ncbi:hypothetical protein ABE427_12950 [Acinetobacter higginsii]|uniref:STM4504/CBY_0614 family protein n=1 Tax=Acinetobacter higginsii TaxID=70347 RepID=UPI00320A38F2